MIYAVHLISFSLIINLGAEQCFLIFCNFSSKRTFLYFQAEVILIYLELIDQISAWVLLTGVCYMWVGVN